MNKWDERFLSLANVVGSWSKDPSTCVGAVIADGNKIISLGFNGFPSGIKDDYSLLKDRNEKYPRIIHAEVNAILSAKRDLDGFTIYTNPVPPCSACSSCIIQSGIKRVVCFINHSEYMERREKDIERSMDMFKQVGIECVYIHSDLDTGQLIANII